MQGYTIRNIINYRQLDWQRSEDIFYLTDVPVRCEPHALKPNYFSYGLLEQGSIDIEIDHQFQTIGTHSLMVYRPDQVIKILHVRPGTRGAFILFTRRFLDKLSENIFSVSQHSFLDYQFGTNIALQPTDHAHLKQLFLKIFGLLKEMHEGSWEYSARNLISALLYQTNDVLKGYAHVLSPAGITAFNVTNHFLKRVGEQFKSGKNLASYASEMHISTNYLHKLVKQQTGKTPALIIHEKLVNEAKTLLGYSQASVSQIAATLGFSGVQAFSKFFKNDTGLSPLRYRQQLPHR